MTHANYPTVDYNSSTGSNTNPSDCVASSVGTGVTASGVTTSANTITFEFGESELEALDLSACADDGTDYIRCSTVGNDRHMFQITAFTPNKGACTSITIHSNNGLEANFTGASWHINGTRQNFSQDSVHCDDQDWHRGWTIRLNGTFVLTDDFEPTRNDDGAAAVDDPILTIKAHPSASSKPIIRQPLSRYLYRGRQRIQTKIQGIRFEATDNSASSFIYLEFSSVTMIDCDLIKTTATQPTVFINAYQNALRLHNCYVKGGGNTVIDAVSSEHVVIDNCHIDCADTYGTTQALALAGENNVIVNTLITEAVGDGVKLDIGGSDGQKFLCFIKNATVADCGGDGLTVTGTPNATTDPEHTFIVTNSLFVGNGGYGVDLTTSAVHVESGDIDWNCVFNNTLGGYSGVDAGDNDVTITTTPFTDAANDDYSLNATATGGALLIGAARMTLPTGS